MKRKTMLFPVLVLVPAFFIYLLYPLSSDSFEIQKDEKSLQQKMAFLQGEASPVPDSQKVNIIWILVDDLGMADTDLYMDGPVTTPQLNRLADEGVKFTNAYISSPVCSPSRAAIATGRYNQRFGYEHQLHNRYLRNRIEYYGFKYFVNSGPWVPQLQSEVPNADFVRNIGLPASEITLAEIVKKQNYRTGYIGKWHLGKNDENSPNQFGFDHFYGFYSSHSLYIPEGSPGIVDQKIPQDFTDKYIWKGQRDDLQAIRLNGEIIQEDRYLTTAITDESIEFLEENKGSPFYLWVSYNAPHTPLQAPDSYVNMFADEPDPVKRVHYAMIKCLDDEIGRLVDYLEQAGLSDNTLIMLISDNGGAEYNLTTHNGPYQGGKITNFEGGVKVPMILRWPERIVGGQVFEHPVHSTDLFATSAGAVGIPLPPGRLYDGANLVDHLPDNSPPHEYIYHEMGVNRGIRDREWKLTWNEHSGDTLLFNLLNDPHEQKDLYVSDDPVVTELVIAFQEWASHNVDPLWPSMIFYHYVADDGSRHYFDE